MKLVTLIIACVFYGVVFSQASLQPYINSKSGGVQSFESVKINFFKKIVGVTSEGVKTKVKSSDLVTALVGKNEEYKSFKHRQVIAFGIKSEKLLSRKGTKIEGKNIYEVVMKSGDNMLVTDKVNTGYWSNNYTGSSVMGGMGMGQTYHSGGASKKQYYYVKGTEVLSLMGTEIFTDEFIDELVTTFGNCTEIKGLLEGYKEKKGKLFKFSALFKDIKQVYLETCFEK